MASRLVNSLAFVGAASLIGTVLGATGSIDALAGAASSEPQYMSPDNPWTVGAPDDGPPRWQRQAFVDRSQDGHPGSASEAFARAPARAASHYSGPVFRNCAAARAAGAAPLYRGQPGYGAHMDGDGDGIACEPYRGR